MKTIRSVILLVVIACLLAGPALHAATDYERVGRDKVSAFFQGALTGNDFSVVSPWRKVFLPANLAQRSPLSLVSVGITEMRLPTNPNGLEALFSVKVKLTEAAWLGNQRIAAGEYTVAGNMTFFETTRGVLIRDCDFVVLDKSGATVGANYLPWKITKP